LGVVFGLVLGKPLGVTLASWLAIELGVAVPPDGITTRQFVGAAMLCGVGDTVALLMADRAFPDGSEATIAKMAVLIGSVVAGALGSLVFITRRAAPARSEATE
jgi:NhaA family Na+:H+ antiporter